MTNKIKKIRNTPFDDVFRTLLDKCNKLVIPVINEMFKTDYSFKDDVQVLSNEQYFFDEEGNEIKKITDSYLKVRDNLYHIECQSTDDSYMEIRMMEYDIHIALNNVTINNGVRIVELPRSAILVVNSDSNFPDFLTSIIRIPRYASSTAFEEITYEVPTCKITNYTKDDIIKKDLIFLAPYYIIKFEKKLDEINNSREQLSELKAEYQEIYNRISELTNADEFDEKYLYDIVSLTQMLIDVVAEGKENIRREVIVMGGNVLKLESDIFVEEIEERFGKLFSKMLESGADSSELQKVAADKEYRKEMYTKYNIQ